MTEKNNEENFVPTQTNFKKQLADMYHSGKRKCDICRKYDIANSLFDKWLK